MCIITLSSNIEEVKATKGMEAKSNEISVAVMMEDLVKGIENPVFYATRYGMLYNPNEDFTPNVKAGQRIQGQHVESYYQQLPEARKEYKKRLADFQASKTGGNDTSSDEAEEMKKLIESLKKKDELIAEQLKKINELSTTKRVEKIVHERFETIKNLLSSKQAVYLHGDAGTGKSRLAEDIAEALDLTFFPASTITQEYKLSGFIDGHGKFHETNFYKAMKYGGVYFLDEMDSCTSEVLVGINGALASGYYDFANGTVYAHKDFRVIGAGNTIGRGATEKFTGRVALDMSTLDRFWGVPIDYSPTIDSEVAHGDKELVDFAHAVRKATKETGINMILSYRSLSRIADFQNMFSLKEIMEMAVIKGIEADDVRMLARNMNLPTTNKYFKAFKEAI
jgi:cobaltochelatase CobS